MKSDVVAGLRAQAAAGQGVLMQSQRELRSVEGRRCDSQEAQRQEAMEQMVRATLRANDKVAEAGRILEEVARSAALDQLTQLPGRVLFNDRLVHAIAGAKRDQTMVALLFLDLGNFREFNEAFGHSVGDELLQLAAQRLTSCVREQDTVSRLSGDEFLVLLDRLPHMSSAARVAEKLIAALRAPHLVGDTPVHLAVSVGISVYPDNGGDAETLIDRADAAMYKAKLKGGGAFAFHGDEELISDGVRPVARFSTAGLRSEAWHSRHAQLQEANQGLLKAALAAQDAQRKQADLLALVVHELRSPLAPISNAAALMGMVPTEELLSRLQAIIKRQVAHLSRLVDDLLDVSRAGTGKLRLERQDVDVALIIEEVADERRPAIEGRKQHLVTHVPGGGRQLTVHADPLRLSQIFGNLLDNASKYTPDGGEIDLSVEVVDGSIRISISDNGLGISAEAMPYIFEPFAQDPHAVQFNGMGLGIGLAVVRELVEAHGGSVVANSAGSGLGSCFIVTLPLEGDAS